MNYVIIGNSTAAAGCIEGIRKADTEGRITVISNEPYHIYGRPLISYLLWGKTDMERMKYRPDDYYEKNNVTTYLGRKAEKIDSAKKTVILDGGEEIPYDRLLVATGSSPFVPPAPGLETVKEKYTFMSLDDALALDKALGTNKDKNVLIIGAGLIGLKCAEGILDKCASLTVVDLAGRVLSSILDDETAAPVQKRLEEKGIKFALGTSAASYEENAAIMKDGKRFEFDILVMAVGVRANTKLAVDAGCQAGRGIKIDSRGETSVKDIYAAGDCAESHDISCDTDRILAILPNAYLQGENAGYNMAGCNHTYDNAIPMNSIGFFGYHIISAGSYTGEAKLITDGENVRKFFISDGLLKGYMLIGNVDRAGIYTSIVRNKIPLDSIDFELISHSPTLMAFTKEYRDSKLTQKI